MLHLVKPPSGGPPTRPSKGRRSAALSLTPEEVRHLRTALKNLARAYGSWSCLAEVMGLRPDAIRTAGRRRRAHPGIALRAARAAGMHVETILSGGLTAAGRCATCGSRIGDWPTIAAGGAS